MHPHPVEAWAIGGGGVTIGDSVAVALEIGQGLPYRRHRRGVFNDVGHAADAIPRDLGRIVAQRDLRGMNRNVQVDEGGLSGVGIKEKVLRQIVKR